jgi:hypothetical protein
MSSTEDWNIIGTESAKDILQAKEEKTLKKEVIYLILHNGRPYGYYYDEEDTDEQVNSAKEHIRSLHAFDFSKDYFWVDCNKHEEYEESDTIVKLQLVSNMKNIVVKYDYTEDSLEVIKTYLLN